MDDATRLLDLVQTVNGKQSAQIGKRYVTVEPWGNTTIYFTVSIDHKQVSWKCKREYAERIIRRNV